MNVPRLSVVDAETLLATPLPNVFGKLGDIIGKK